MPFFSMNKKGGAHTIAKKPESKNVTINDSAARIPATTITKAASTKMTRAVLENPLVDCIVVPVR